MSNSNFETLKLELSLLGMKVPDVVAVLQDEVRELIISKNELLTEVEETGTERDTLKQCIASMADELEAAFFLRKENKELKEENKKLVGDVNQVEGENMAFTFDAGKEIQRLRDEIKELRGESVEVA